MAAISKILKIKIKKRINEFSNIIITASQKYTPFFCNKNSEICYSPEYKFKKTF